MSCYIIETRYIKRIVLSFRQYFLQTQHTSQICIPGEDNYSDITEIDTLKRIGQVLIDQNYRSYNTRYDELEQPNIFEITGQDLMYMSRLTPVETLKALASYDYQSCETPDWQQTDAYKLVGFIRYCAISALPGYNDAKWI